MRNLFEPPDRNLQAHQPSGQLRRQPADPASAEGVEGPADPPTGRGAGPGWDTRPSAGAGPGWDAAPGRDSDLSRTAPLGQQPPGLRDHMARDRRKAAHWAVALVAAALLAGGGIVAGMALAGNSGPRGTATMSGAPGLSGQAALLNTTLSGAGAPGALAPAAAAVAPQSGSQALGGAVRPCARALRLARLAGRAGFPLLAHRARLAAAHCRLARHRVFRFFLLRGVDGQFTFQTAGGLKTLAYERGTIESISPGNSIVVRANDGITWTWELVSTTVVRDPTGKVAEGALAVGQPVWVGGPVLAGTKDARLIVIRPPTLGTTPSAAPGN